MHGMAPLRRFSLPDAKEQLEQCHAEMHSSKQSNAAEYLTTATTQNEEVKMAMTW